MGWVEDNIVDPIGDALGSAGRWIDDELIQPSIDLGEDVLPDLLKVGTALSTGGAGSGSLFSGQNLLKAGGLASDYLTAKQQSDAAKAAAQAGVGASNEWIRYLQEAQQRQEQLTEPFRQLGVGALGPLSEQVQAGSSPLFKALEEDVSRRIFANQAARGKLGSGETPAALGTALAPLRIQQRQQDISNLFDMTRLGANVATGQGTAAMRAAEALGNPLMSRGEYSGQGRLGQAAALGGGLTSLFGPGGSASGLFNTLGGLFGSGSGDFAGAYRPTVGGDQLAGPFDQLGRF